MHISESLLRRQSSYYELQQLVFQPLIECENPRAITVFFLHVERFRNSKYRSSSPY